jgi:hypothetical protein
MSMSPDRPLLKRLFAGRFGRLAPYFALGPISGPLTAGIVLNFRGGRPILASLYGLTLSLWLTLGPLDIAHALAVTRA